MSQNSNKEKHISVRVTNGTHSQLTTYAKANNLTLSKAVETLLQRGLVSELEPLATRNDIQLLKSEYKQHNSELEKSLLLLKQAIENQPLVTQQLAAPADADAQREHSRLKRAWSALRGKD